MKHSVCAGLFKFARIILLVVPLAAAAQSQTIVTVAGTGEQGYAGDGGLATSALLAPEGLSLDHEGNLFIAEPVNHVVRRIDHATGIITTYAGTGQTAYNGEGLKATATNLDYPTGVAVGPHGDVYIADYGSTSRIWRVDRHTLTMRTVVGGSERGFSGDGGPASGALINATDIAFDRHGNLVISDSGNDRIRRVDRRTGIITTVVGGGINGAGPASGPAMAAGFLYYITTAFNRQNDMFFADSVLSTVRELDARRQTFTTVAGVYPGTTGVAFLAGYNGDGQPATQALLNYPSHIAADCAGNLTISDSANYRVRQVDRETGVIETIAGTGTAGYSGDRGLAVQAMLMQPRGLAFGRDGALYVADGVRIRKIDGLPGHHRWDCRDERRYHLDDDRDDGGKD
ncbi:NHL repeat-containing protein [Paraburkholderia sp. RAU2J]|uniref:NHL domain-containing protein n=1 Tax=Paraburkholderia sp. RAU2J TaxID=1938810 RepID=UPI000F21B757|nr:sugar ABC transporter ATP-binding protein [Paraburkholderia sp. RAU2J]RKT13963.1 NHL repeat-containing protein [Paraburkholderia sp. RAU2J]